jgi:hypothetical protein
MGFPACRMTLAVVIENLNQLRGRPLLNPWAKASNL